jgi:peptidoglycan/xylan/chitin deacetylase (PgdA/CDA1 family)
MKKECHNLENATSLNLPHLELPDHYRPRQCAAIWNSVHIDWKKQLAAACEKAVGSHTPSIFFRADDIGAGGRAFEALCQIFRFHRIPLAMAVVPAWLSDVRRQQLFQAAPLEEPLWGWHQHGWRHVNWQRTGKKSEFGEQRPFDKQMKDIVQGREKMQAVFGNHLLPVFTPPWNRLSSSTLKILQDLGFNGVSITGPFPRGSKTTIKLKNLRVQLDLHTRKNRDGESDFQTLLDEISTLLGKKEPFGIMIHHQRMNHFAFEFLNELLSCLKSKMGVRFLSLQEMLEKVDEE